MAKTQFILRRKTLEIGAAPARAMCSALHWSGRYSARARKVEILLSSAELIPPSRHQCQRSEAVRLLRATESAFALGTQPGDAPEAPWYAPSHQHLQAREIATVFSSTDPFPPMLPDVQQQFGPIAARFPTMLHSGVAGADYFVVCGYKPPKRSIRSLRIRGKSLGPFMVSSLTSVIWDCCQDSAGRLELLQELARPGAERRNDVPTTPSVEPVCPAELFQLLWCRGSEIRSAGLAAKNRLTSMDELVRGYWLQWLATMLQTTKSSSPVPAHPNYVAALELIARFDPRRASSLTIAALASRPISVVHLFLLALSRELIEAEAINLREIVAHATSITAEIQNRGAPSNRLDRAILAQALSLLSTLAPDVVLAWATRHLPTIEGVEATAILDSVAQAARQLPKGDAAPLQDVTRALWDVYAREDDVTARDNLPGVIARTLELMGLAGQSAAEIIKMVGAHPLASHFLYLFAQRPLDFFDPGDRRLVYQSALTLLLKSNHRIAMRKLLDVILLDREVPAESLVSFTPAVGA